MAEQFGVVLGAVASFLVALGGTAIWRGRKETKAGEGPSQLAVLKQSLDRMVVATEKNTEQMARNLEHFEAVREDTRDMARMASEAVSVVRNVEHKLIEMSARRGG